MDKDIPFNKQNQMLFAFLNYLKCVMQQCLLWFPGQFAHIFNQDKEMSMCVNKVSEGAYSCFLLLDVILQSHV